MTRRKTTVYIDDELLTATRVLAASTGRHDYEIVEQALRMYMRDPDVAQTRQELTGLLDRVAATAPSDGDGDRLAEATDEVHAMRREHSRGTNRR